MIDESGRWAEQSAKSCAHWLSWRLALDAGTAREQVRVARKIAGLPLLNEELRSARITCSQARAITRVATPQNEQRLVEIAKHSTVPQLERVVRGVRTAEAEDVSTGEPERRVRERTMPDGREPDYAACVSAVLASAPDVQGHAHGGGPHGAPQRPGAGS